ILQDVHWSDGNFGYFPTYALGNAYSAQILNAMEKDIDVQSNLRAADFSKIDAWLAEKIHRYGSLLSPDEILAQITDEGFSPRYYIEYLTDKYESLYHLRADSSGGGCATGVFSVSALLILAVAALRRRKR
ncbi:MAG: SYNERG-CTERM sorting domain-containing protein, partial [Syntrophorhabdaceae bacterium]|nr:SYNERG-CTERM sorting domain-containing protein [Syntrophorhabdaceae bacterium]